MMIRAPKTCDKHKPMVETDALGTSGIHKICIKRQCKFNSLITSYLLLVPKVSYFAVWFGRSKTRASLVRIYDCRNLFAQHTAGKAFSFMKPDRSTVVTLAFMTRPSENFMWRGSKEMIRMMSQFLSYD